MRLRGRRGWATHQGTRQCSTATRVKCARVDGSSCGDARQTVAQAIGEPRVLSSAGRASPLQGECRRFDPVSTHQVSLRWHLFCRPKVLGVVVQLVRIPACHAGGRGFEPRPLRQYKRLILHGIGRFSLVLRIPAASSKVWKMNGMAACTSLFVGLNNRVA